MGDIGQKAMDATYSCVFSSTMDHHLFFVDATKGQQSNLKLHSQDALDQLGMLPCKVRNAKLQS